MFMMLGRLRKGRDYSIAELGNMLACILITLVNVLQVTVGVIAITDSLHGNWQIHGMLLPIMHGWLCISAANYR